MKITKTAACDVFFRAMSQIGNHASGETGRRSCTIGWLPGTPGRDAPSTSQTARRYGRGGKSTEYASERGPELKARSPGRPDRPCRRGGQVDGRGRRRMRLAWEGQRRVPSRWPRRRSRRRFRDRPHASRELASQDPGPRPERVGGSGDRRFLPRGWPGSCGFDKGGHGRAASSAGFFGLKVTWSSAILEGSHVVVRDGDALLWATFS